MTLSDWETGEINWERYKGSKEPEDHWYLRKKFLSHNYGKISEHLLFCLSGTFASIQIFGCKYPAGTAELIAKLSADFIEEIKLGVFPETEEDFKCPTSKSLSVGPTTEASCEQVFPVKIDAATKISRNNVALQSLLRIEEEGKVEDVVSSEQISHAGVLRRIEARKPQIVNNPFLRTYSHIASAIDPTVCTVFDLPALTEYLDEIFLLENGKNSAKTILVQSFKWCRKHEYIRFEIEESRKTDRIVKCDLIFGARNSKNVVFHGDGKIKKEAKGFASEKALIFFRKLRPTIKVTNTAARKVKRQEISPPEVPPPAADVDIMNTKDSVAVKMMQAMGWKGGGLGRNEDGLSVPVSDLTVLKSSRTGFGYSNLAVPPLAWKATTEMKIGKWMGFEEQIEWFLRTVEKSLLDQDVQFPSNFSRQERKVVHEVAQRMGLSTESFGSGSKRHLVVSKTLQPKDIFRIVVQSGGETLRYKIRLPGV